MSFKHKLSRRLAALYTVAAAAFAIGCADAPTSAAEELPVRPAHLDPALAVSGTNVVGQRVSADRYVQVFASASRRSSVLGQQRDRAQGVILAGPTTPTYADPYPLVQVNFDTGPDGWVFAVYMSLLAPVVVPPPPPPPVVTVASVQVTPSTATLLTGTSLQLAAAVRDSAGNVLGGRTVTWSSSNAVIAIVSSSGSVTALAVGTATITATSSNRSGTAAITVQAPVIPPPPPPPTGNATFASQWATAIGTTSSAYLDGNNATPWGFVCCSGNANSAISTAASLGLTKWPVANVYRVGMQAGATGIQTHQIQADLGAPAANSHRYFRFYLQVAYGDDHGSSSESTVEHGVETTSETYSGGRGFNLMRLPRNDGTWFPVFRDIASGWRYVASDLRLAKNRTYRLEWHITYGASTYGIQIRIYNEDGVLVATEADFFQYLPMRDTSARLGVMQFPYLAADHRYFRVGTNGPSSNFPMANFRNDNIFLHGAVAVCTTGWCGPVAP